MKDEGWRMKNEEWRMEDEEWRMKNEEWKMKNEEWRIKNEEWRMKKKEWRMKNEEWRMKNNYSTYLLDHQLWARRAYTSHKVNYQPRIRYSWYEPSSSSKYMERFIEKFVLKIKSFQIVFIWKKLRCHAVQILWSGQH